MKYIILAIYLLLQMPGNLFGVQSGYWPASSILGKDGNYFGYFENRQPYYIVVKILKPIVDGNKNVMMVVWGPHRVAPESYVKILLPAGNYTVVVEDWKDQISHVLKKSLTEEEIKKYPDEVFIWCYEKEQI